MNNTKEVYFAQYCPNCKHYEDDESDPNSPCWDCMNEGFNIDSHKPVKFKEK